MFDKQFSLLSKIKIGDKNSHWVHDKTNKIKNYREMFTQISWMQLFGKLVKALKIPLIAAKYQLLTNTKTYFRTQPFPWFKLSLIILFLYVFFQKDMQFNINTGTPPSFLSESSERNNKSEFSMNGIAKTTNFSDKKASNELFTVHLEDEDVKFYITRFTKVALAEMQKFKIPASIKMGQAIMASQAGQSALAQQYNNHFGIVCKDENNCQDFEFGNRIIKVQSYQSAWESWRNHSLLLSSTSYAHLKQYGKNYKKWAKGLEQAGYGTPRNYSEHLIQIIEKYQLNKLDELNENL